MLLKLVQLSGCRSVAAGLTGRRGKMDIQQTSDLAVEIDLAALEATAKECTGVDVENCSSQSQTIRLDQTPYRHAVTNFDFSHDSPLLIEQICAGIQKLSPRAPGRAKQFCGYR